MLAELDALPFDVALEDVTDDPGWPEGVEWFASAEDIAAAHAALAERAASDPTVAEVLGQNPGIEIDPSAWPSVAFKGGSSPGVLTGSWRGVASDGRTLTVVLLASSEDAAQVTESQAELFGLAADVIALEAAQQ